MKNIITRSFFAFLSVAFLVSISHVSAQETLPGVLTIEKRLEMEIDKIIAAGHLRPAYHNAHEKLHIHRGSDVSRKWNDYWSNPAETIYTLIRALPHLPEEKQTSLRNYIQQEWTEYPPYLYSHSGWGTGAQREHFDIPADAQNHYLNPLTPGTPDAWDGYVFNPFNIYASWLYAKEFGNAAFILDQVRSKVAAFPTTLTDNKPHLLNMYIAGYIGYLNLQDLAGEPRSATVEGWLTSALNKRISLLAIQPQDLRALEANGFLYLVPELGEYLHEHAFTQVQQSVGTYNDFTAPYWFAAKIDETDRIGPRAFSHLEEGSISLNYNYSSLFNAKAMALKESRAELERYLDVPAVYRGDLFYIQNLVSVLEAPSMSSGSPTPTGNPTPSGTSSTPGDTDSDGDVDIFDYNAVLGNMGTMSGATRNGGDLDGDGDVDIFDFNEVIGNFGR